MTKPVTPSAVHQDTELDQALADLDRNVVRLEALVATIIEAGRGAPPLAASAAIMRLPVQPRLRTIAGGRAHA